MKAFFAAAGIVVTAIVIGFVGTGATGNDKAPAAEPLEPSPTVSAAHPGADLEAVAHYQEVEWVQQRVASDPAAFCEDRAEGRRRLRDMRGQTISRDALNAGMDRACPYQPTPAPTPEPIPAETKSHEDRVIASFRHNLNRSADGGFCDMYPASGKANTVTALEMMYPEAAEVLSRDEIWDMLQGICAAD